MSHSDNFDDYQSGDFATNPMKPGIYDPRIVDPTIKSSFDNDNLDKMAPSPDSGMGGGRPSDVIAMASFCAGQPANQCRAENARSKMCIWENDFRALIINRLISMFHPENFQRMRLMPHLSSNLLERVVNDISVMYSAPAVRKLIARDPSDKDDPATEDVELMQDVPSTDHPLDSDPDIKMLSELLNVGQAVSPTGNTAFDRLMKVQDWDVLLDTVEKLCCFMPTVWVGPRVDDSGTLHYIIYTPAHADVVVDPGNPYKALGFWYKAEEWDAKNRKVVQVIHFWEPDTYSKLSSDWKVLSTEPNKLGRLPVVAFRIKVPTNKYHTDGIGNDLLEGTLELAILRTMQDCRVRDSSFKQLAISGDTESVPADQVMGGPAPIFLGDQGTASVLDLQPAIDQYTKLCRERGLELAAKYGITSADYTSDKVPQSGFSKKLDQAKINKESRRRRKFFEQGEKELYELVVATVNAFPVAEIGPMDDSQELSVQYADAVFEEDPEKQNRIDASEMQLGKTNIFEIWRRDHPDMTDIEILRQLKLNQLINQTFVTTEQAAMLKLLAQEAAIEGVSKSGNKPGGVGGQPTGPTAAGPGDAPNGPGAGGTAGV